MTTTTTRTTLDPATSGRFGGDSDIVVVQCDADLPDFDDHEDAHWDDFQEEDLEARHEASATWAM